MTQPRYQIFVSSTFKDLEDERQAVLNAILKLNQFPAGMEMFPAVDDTAWLHIEKVIEVSDYYVLIIGGKYGSIDSESGLSYTEKEYDFAVSKNIPVLAFTRSDEDNIPVGKSEIDSQIREKLKQFKQKVGNKHHWNYWKNLDELKANVAISLAMSFATNPQKGWVKAGVIENSELLERLADLQQRYDKSLEENKKLSEKTLNTNFSFGNEIVIIKLNEIESSIESTWHELFIILAKIFITKTTERELKKAQFNIMSNKKVVKGNLSDESFNLIRNQFLALELIEIVDKSINGTQHTAWVLSSKGQRLFVDSVAIKSKHEGKSEA
jgi:Domain of unknown function (DUF4062)